MTPARAIYFLERFKREEKWLGPHEQWALDFTIATLSPAVSSGVEEVPDGWKLVPIEATVAMCAAFTDAALRGSVHGAGGWHGYAREQWATMLAAAPASPDTPPADHRQR